MQFEKALIKIDLILREAVAKKIIASYALIGGMAVAAWGMVRATKDIDFLVSLARRESALPEFEGIIKNHKINYVAHKGDHDDPKNEKAKDYTLKTNSIRFWTQVLDL